MMLKRPVVARTYLRLGLGLAVVASSVIAALVILDSRETTRSVVVFREDMMPGSTVLPDHIDVVQTVDDPVLGPCLSADGVSGLSGLVLRRTVTQGEMLQLGDFVEPTRRDDSVVALSLQIGQPDWLQPGGLVQLWVAPPAGENAFSGPFVLSPEGVIERVSQDEGFAADGSLSMVDIRLPTRDVPGVIHALANRYFLHLVPISPSTR